jgi:hypothetical protein
VTAPDSQDGSVASVGDVPVCPGCGLAAHITHGKICGECFQRREAWMGGGGIRVVPEEGNIHWTAECPDFDPDGIWWLWRDEDAMYRTLFDGDDYCPTCKWYHVSGFNEGEKA